MDLTTLHKPLSESLGREVQVRFTISPHSSEERIKGEIIAPDLMVSSWTLKIAAYPAILTIPLHHTNCHSWSPPKVLKSLPYYCIECGNKVISESLAPILGLPIKKVKRKIKIHITPMGYKGGGKAVIDEIQGLDLTEWGGWIHKCGGHPENGRSIYASNKREISSFPYECPFCLQLLGSKETKMESLFGVAAMMRDK